MKKNKVPKTIYLKDYQVPSYNIEKTDLCFELFDEYTLVTAKLFLSKNLKSADNRCRLAGENLECVSISINDKLLTKDQYFLNDETLTIVNPKSSFILTTVAKIYPQKNTELEGLYQSNGNFCTQCEAQGFKKITWYLDRPDVLSLFTTTIIADKKSYPVILSNGNPVGSGKTDDGRDWITWSDPNPKPCYLFALVAGNLVSIKDRFITKSGKEVALEIYVQAHNKDKCAHAMGSLKSAMKWDEDVYGLEYDLDIYMIVAVDDFNMGAMENKGLNIFNSRFVLADDKSATDEDYQNIEAVIAHEYFHNWTGNRVTCRDWFQLSLKEGLTVFRDQEFSSDMGSRAVKRIKDVRLLRARQFAEDASAMAHPIRPESYIEMNNFYTSTVYEKGAEVIRMQHTLLGKEGFRKGIDLYFKRHDGQAVTCDDFRASMADANNFDMVQFEQWYKQSGTPIIAVTDEYDKKLKKYTLKFKQTSPDTPGQTNKPPLMIPVKTALITDAVEQEKLIVLTKKIQEMVYEKVKTRPTPSLLRGFSAPVKLNYSYNDRQLAKIIEQDNDDFNRWEACQILATRIILRQKNSIDKENTTESLVTALSSMMEGSTDPALLAEMLTLPDEITLSGLLTPIDIDYIYLHRETLKRQIALRLEKQIVNNYLQLQQELSSKSYQIDALSIAKRRLKNVCLGYMGVLAKPEYTDLAVNQYDVSNNMTDSFSALRVLLSESLQGFDTKLAHFEQKWKTNSLVMDKWFTLQMVQKKGNIVTTAKKLMAHECFNFSNPNKVRSIIGTFAMSNPVQFHHKSGRGYAFVAEQVVKLDKINSQVAARIVLAFSNWKAFDKQRQEKIEYQLKTLIKLDRLSKGVYEVVSKALKV